MGGASRQQWSFDMHNWTIASGLNTSKCADAGGMSRWQRLMIWECNSLPQQAWGYDPDARTVYLLQSVSNARWCLGRDDDSGMALLQSCSLGDSTSFDIGAMGDTLLLV